MGGQLVADSGNNSFYVTAACLAEDLQAALDIFADVTMRPTFPEVELEKMRRLMLAALQRQNDDWQTEVRNLFRQTYFTTSPYRLQPNGQEAALQRLTRQDVSAFYQRYAVPNNMVLAIVGDIDVERTAALVERAFTGFKAQPLSLPQVPAEPVATESRRRIKQTRKQVAAIQIGFPGTTVAHVADRDALHILDAILSGIGFPGGWLHTELRGKQLVYYVHAFNWFGLEPGYFGVIAATQPPQAQEVVEIILRQIDKARSGEISEAELARAKQLAVIADRLDRQTNSERAMTATLDELYGLGYAFSTQTAERLSQVTKADVQRVAQAYLQHPTIVITTPQP
jgi:zinc protease